MVTPSTLNRAQIGYWRMELGEILITVVSDGTVTRDARQMLTGVAEERIDQLMDLHYRTPQMQLSMNMMLIDTGSRITLIDAGAGDLFKPEGGLLPQNLKSAGYDPDSIDDVVLSHIHADHSGGLVNNGAIVFRNAEIHVPSRDLLYFLDEEVALRAPLRIAHVFRQARACLGPYVDSGKARVYEWGQQIVPGITSRAAGGHTPGHSHLVVESAGQKLIFLGDTIHVGEVQFACPCAAIAFDVDPLAAVNDRKRALAEATKEGYWVGFSHVSFPGIGHIRKDGDNFAWVPAPYELTTTPTHLG